MRNKRYMRRMKTSLRNVQTVIERARTDSNHPWWMAFIVEESDPAPELLELIVTLTEGVESIKERKAEMERSEARRKANEEESRRLFLAAQQGAGNG